MDSYDFKVPEPSSFKLPRLHKLKRPRTNFFNEKEKPENSSKFSFRDNLKNSRGLSKDNIKSVNPFIIQEYPKDPAIISREPCTKAISDWSKRIKFNQRAEMTMKNLLILNFDGVVGDCFKKNLWDEAPVKLYIRRSAIKELKRLLNVFQIALFFISNEINVQKVLAFFDSKDLNFDAVYKSRNHSKYTKKNLKNPRKKPLKYTEGFQDYSQVFLDFGYQNEILEKVLIVTSVALSPEDSERTAEENICHRDSQFLISFLCKGLPIHKYQSIFPIVLAVPDPRAHHNFAGASFTTISQSIYSLAQETEEWSWLDGFCSSQLEKIETNIVVNAFHKERIEKNILKETVKFNSWETWKKNISRESQSHRIIFLKNSPLTNYHFVQDHAFSIKPLHLKNL